MGIGIMEIEWCFHEPWRGLLDVLIHKAWLELIVNVC